MILKVSVHEREGDSAPEHLRRYLPDLVSWKDYYLESDRFFTTSEQSALARAFANPVTQRAVIDEPLPARGIQVSYKRGIVDNENDSIVVLCAALGIEISHAKVATAYLSADPSLEEMIDSHACNHNIEQLWRSDMRPDTLSLQGAYEPMKTINLLGLSDEELATLGRKNGRSLEPDKMRAIATIQRSLGLSFVTDVLLEALDARWSDHCAHTTWKSHGNLLRVLMDAARATNNSNIVSMFADNAGIWAFYDGWGIAIKGETHNGPSAVSAYFGQLTKLGGVLRDILGTGQGADPIGSFEYTATGNPDSSAPLKGRPGSKQIANETIRAIKEYGNTFGVPMMSSHMTFHPGYRAKPFALGGSIGVIPLERAPKGTPVSGDMAMLIGGLTGNDGIHGASASSAGAVMDATSVQIGSPLEAIKFREAIVDLRDADCIRAITDLGAAGINSAFGELGEDTGVWLNMALVPLKSSALPMWRILLSESQERMALVIPPEKLDSARTILCRHDVRSTVIGRFTNTNRYTVIFDEALSESDVVNASFSEMPLSGEVGIDIDYEAMKYVPPSRQVAPVPPHRRVANDWPVITPASLDHYITRVCEDTEVADQRFADEQYDSSVQGRHCYGPVSKRTRIATGYTAIHPVLGHPGAVTFATAFNPWLYEANPVLAARQCFASLLLRHVLAGVRIEDVCLCDNFYTPHLEPSWDRWLVGMVHELAELSQRFGTPFISGKDSSAGSVHTDEGVVSVPNAVFLAGLGKVPDATALRKESLHGEGNAIVRIGLETPGLAGTAIARVMSVDSRDIDDINSDDVEVFLRSIERVDGSFLVSGKVIDAGGALMTMAAMSQMNGDLGVDITCDDDVVTGLFHEHRVGAIVEVRVDVLEKIPAEMRPVVLGVVTPGVGVRINRRETFSPRARSAWSNSFAEALR